MEKKMPRIVGFTNRSFGYGCTEPGDMAGKYIPVSDLLKFLQDNKDSTAIEDLIRHLNSDKAGAG